MAQEDLGKLLLRLSVAGLLLMHGVAKILGGIDPLVGMIESKGLPGFLAYGVYVGEVVAPIFVIVGVKTRLFALVIAINMVVAVGLAHAADVASLNQGGGWAVELQALYGLGAVAIALLGPGRYAVARHGRFD